MRYLESKPSKVWYELFTNYRNRLSESNSKEVKELLTIIMYRVKNNIQSIVSKLDKIGYVFTDPHRNQRDLQLDPIYQAPSKSDKSLLKDLITMCKPYGYLPATFISFLEIVGTVNLVGFFKDWKNSLNFPLLDPFMILPLNTLVKYPEYFLITKDNRNYTGNNFLVFSYDKLIKENVSGDLGFGVKLYPYPIIDARLINYDEDIDMLFLDYLRLTFKWGGFPYLEWYEDTISNDVKDRINFLKQDLLPI